MGQPSNDEIAARAEALYEQGIRASVEPGNVGKFLVIDIRSGDYTVDENDMAAMKRAAARHPDGLFHVMRIGHRTLGRIGARFTRTDM